MSSRRRAPIRARRPRVLTAALASGALLLGVAGCGSSAPAAGDQPASRRSGTVTSTPTSSTTTTTQTTTAPLPGSGRPPITLGDMNTPEQFIIGQMYALALSAEGYSLSLTQNIGTTSVSDAALKQGSLDIFPEYLNIWDTEVAGAKGTFRSLAAADRFGASYAAKQGFELLPPTPFSDTDGIAVTSAVAALNHLRTIPNLQSVAYDLVFGAPLEFLQSGNGLKALEQIYHFQPAQTRTVDIGSQYTELTDGTVGAALVYTTDPQLSSDQYTLLRDPKHFFGFGNVVPVTTKAVLQKEGPVFVRTIESIDSLLTQQVMMTLNGEVELDGQAPIDVARAFLDEHGLLPGPSGS